MDVAPVFKPARSKYLVFTADYLIPFFIIISVLTSIGIALYSPIFKITVINCSLDYKECGDASVVAELDKFKGRNIFRISSNEVTSRLTSGDFTIRQAEFTRSLPGTINLNLQSVYPSVALKVESDPTWVILDSKLRVIGTRSTDPNVPTVLIQGPLTVTVGKPLNQDGIKHALNLAMRLAEQLFSVKSISLISDDIIQLNLADGKIALFTPKKDEMEQLKTLQLVLADDTISKEVETIDVRFAQPVLR